MAESFTPVRDVLAPWLKARGTGMLAGWRGGGKTFATLDIALAVASGGSTMGFRAPAPLATLYVDGEMDPAELQERLGALREGKRLDQNGKDEELPLYFLSQLAQREEHIPDLASEDGAGRFQVELALEKSQAEFLVIDNISSLMNSGIENTSESWEHVQSWLNDIRSEERGGITVLMIHHTGKPREGSEPSQRGASKREDGLSTEVILTSSTKKAGYFKLHWNKQRQGLKPSDKTVKIEWPNNEGPCRLCIPGWPKDECEAYTASS